MQNNLGSNNSINPSNNSHLQSTLIPSNSTQNFLINEKNSKIISSAATKAANVHKAKGNLTNTLNIQTA